MAKVYYIGPSVTGVDVAMPDGSGAHVDHGDALETDDEHAKSLAEQEDNWSAKPPAKAKASPKADDAAADETEG